MDDDRPIMLQNIGVVILVLTIGIPALEHAGFTVLLGKKLGWDFTTSLAIAAFGGAFGGALLAGEHVVAGLLGGLLAGPGGFLAVYFYVLDRQSVHTYETVLVQIVGSLPGIGLFYLIKRLRSPQTSTGETGLAVPGESVS